MFVVNPSTNNVRRVTNDPLFDGDPAWFPGNVIAFVSGRSGSRDVWTIEPNGTGLRQVLHMKGPEADPAWAPPR